MKNTNWFYFLLLFGFIVNPTFAQSLNQYTILGINIEGATDDNSRQFALQSSGLISGSTIAIPGDPISDAIRALYQSGAFSDVQIEAERFVDNGVFLLIRVVEEPRLADYSFVGVRRSQRTELKKLVPLLRGRAVREADIERTNQTIRDYYDEKGYKNVQIEVNRTPASNNRVNLEFTIERGDVTRVREIYFTGNNNVSSRKLRKAMKETKVRRWYLFWRGAKLDQQKYDDDLSAIVSYYNNNGYYDARIVSDSVSYQTDDEGNFTNQLAINIEIFEGKQYFFRNIMWEGNTEYTDDQLTQTLAIKTGSTYNLSKFQENLYGNAQSTDVASLYLNRGYVKYQTIPTFTVIGDDSLDLNLEVFEGDIYTFGDITIAGNEKTKDHVIRRELRTIPGQVFSRDAIQRSIRELMQLNYFDQEKMGGGPQVMPNDATKTVDLGYTFEETGTDQIEFSGGWGGSGLGLILSTKVTFNNFSLQNVFDGDEWKGRLPSGDGQQLSLGVQIQGKFYQTYSLSFSEPWLGGKPTRVGFSISHSRNNGSYQNSLGFGGGLGSNFGGGGQLQTTSFSLTYGKRLKWPDDYFQFGSSAGYTLFSVDEEYARSRGGTLPVGLSQQLRIINSITRNSFDNPIFPSSGSNFTASLELAPPVGDFIQYHKWKFAMKWAVPIVGKLSFSAGFDYGYLGSLQKGKRVTLQRFVVGGTPLEAQGGYGSYGIDRIFMRGYPSNAIRASNGGGGSILNKYDAELTLVAVATPQFQLAPYAFISAANTWDGLDEFAPTQLYRSAGVGARIFLPILGMIELVYGYNFDNFARTSAGEDGDNKWRFQFSLGQGF